MESGRLYQFSRKRWGLSRRKERKYEKLIETVWNLKRHETTIVCVCRVWKNGEVVSGSEAMRQRGRSVALYTSESKIFAFSRRWGEWREPERQRLMAKRKECLPPSFATVSRVGDVFYLLRSRAALDVNRSHYTIVILFPEGPSLNERQINERYLITQESSCLNSGDFLPGFINMR